MDELIKDHLFAVITIIIGVIVVILSALYKLGWLSMGQKDAVAPTWDGTERRECALHSSLNQKVCSLYTKIDDIDAKLDDVAEKLEYVRGALETRWGKKL